MTLRRTAGVLALAVALVVGLQSPAAAATATISANNGYATATFTYPTGPDAEWGTLRVCDTVKDGRRAVAQLSWENNNGAWSVVARVEDANGANGQCVSTSAYRFYGYRMKLVLWVQDGTGYVREEYPVRTIKWVS